MAKQDQPISCDWWQSDNWPDEPIWHTQCGKCDASEANQATANAVASHLYTEYCPWCGGEWAEISESEIIAEEIAEEDYQYEIRHMKL